jgi:hypothetical protein
MQINLTLSKNTAVSTSAWTGTAQERVEYVGGLQRVYTVYTYSAPDVISDDSVTVTVPPSLSGVKFVSARLSYDVLQTQAGRSRTLQFADTGKNVTDKAILARLRAGDTSFRIRFYFRAAGGTGGSGANYATCTWKNLKLAAEYTPAGRIHGHVAVAGVTFSLSGSAGGGGSVTREVTASEGGAWDDSFNFTLPQTDASLWSARVGASADICILIAYSDGTSASAGPVSVALKLVRERLAPALSLDFTDTAGVFAVYGAYVQNRSSLAALPSVTLDTEADQNNSVSAVSLLFGGSAYGGAG